ncbi:MAG: hypothetical protein QXN24_03920 [Candidatus Bathyarchaeia archaeon]
MPSLEVLTVNEASRSIEEILEIIWRALEYFPRGLWDEVMYIGNADIKYDIKVEIKGESYRAFIFNNLLGKIKRIREAMKIKDLLLAVTANPVIAIYSKLGSKGISRVASLVHDYLSSDIGIVSLFAMKDDATTMVTAHGLGHSRGLRHHAEPIDLMYEGLLKSKSLSRDGFCESCLRRIIGDEGV